MAIKSIFGKHKIKSYFRFRQNGNIWRLFFNNSGIVAGETRDIITKQAYIFTYDIINKKECLKNFQLEEKWWFAIDALTDKTIIVSAFQKPEMPEHRGFKVLDIKSGKTVWENEQYEFFFADNEHIFVIKQLFESRNILKLNMADGSLMEEYKGDDINTAILLKNENDLKIYEGLINTEILDFSDNIFTARFPGVVDNLKKLKLHGEVEYIDTDEYLILNHHCSKGINMKDINEALLTNTIEIYNGRTNEIEFTDILNNETSSYVPDSFFIRNGFLFYIKEKSELICIKLNT